MVPWLNPPTWDERRDVDATPPAGSEGGGSDMANSIHPHASGRSPVSSLRTRWTVRAQTALVSALRQAAEQFPHPGYDGATQIHESRKALKLSASLARLFVPVMTQEAYRALEVIDGARRKVGRARDLDILPGVLGTLRCNPATRDELMRAIAIERGRVRQDHADIDAPGLTSSLQEHAELVNGWDLSFVDTEALTGCLRHSYRSAKRRGRIAWSSGDADDLHSLRLRVVDLGHQLALLTPAWPAMIGATTAELHKLRQSLGDYNDLTVLGEFALSRREVTSEAIEEFVALVLRKRRPLERRARSQFERLFAERPGAFGRRIACYLAHPQKGSPA